VVEGFVAGRHRSPYKGFSVEFAEHRQYVPGDNIRDLDWRVFGKSDRYYIKQYVEETNLRATILLDASGSMAYAGDRAHQQDGDPLSKFAYGRLLAASLAHLMIHQADAVGLVVHDDQVRRYIPARARPSHLRVLCEELVGHEPGAETALAPVYHDVAERIGRRGLVIVLSDLLDEPDALLEALHHFRYRKHEVVVFHLLAEEELTFPFDRPTVLHDLEPTGLRRRLDPRAIRSAYLDQLRAHLRTIEQGCGRMHVDYVPLSTAEPFDQALAEYLARRLERR
jgi:uncharacterized protein (DUF58 family)